MEEFRFVDVVGARRGIDRAPNECPLCHYVIHPNQHSWLLIGEHTRKVQLEIVYQCPRDECAHLFIAQYCLPSRAGTAAELSHSPDFLLYNVYPILPKSPDVPSNVSSMSAGFQDIYSQALAADALRLSQIAGGGLRKALEFLIRDYCCYKCPDDRESIRSKLLGSCIQDFVNDENVKACAKRAAWLGNDEIHYLRRWTDKDIQDLKVLLNLTIGWIQNELLTKHYIDSMPETQ